MRFPLAEGTIVYPYDGFAIIAEKHSLGLYSEQSNRYEVILRLKSTALVSALSALNFPHTVGSNPVVDRFLTSETFTEHMAAFFHVAPKNSALARGVEERSLRVREVLQRLDGATDVGHGALIFLARQAVASTRFLFIGSIWDHEQTLNLTGWNFQHLRWPVDRHELPPDLDLYLDSQSEDVVVVADLTEAGATRAHSLLELVAARGGTVLPVCTTDQILSVGPTLFACDAWDIQTILDGLPATAFPSLPTWGQRIIMGLVESELPFTVKRIVEAQKRDISLAVRSIFCLDLRSMSGQQVEMSPEFCTKSISSIIEQFEKLFIEI